MADIPTENAATQDGIDQYREESDEDWLGMEEAQRAKLDNIAIFQFSEYGIDLAGIRKIQAYNKGVERDESMWVYHVKRYLKVGITDLETMIELHGTGLDGGTVGIYRELGITGIDDLQRLGEAGMGYPSCAEDARYCQFNSVDKILAAVEAGKANGVKNGYWHIVHRNAAELGAFGQRLLKSHPIPATTIEVMSRSTVLEQQLDRLDDSNLRTVVALLEEGKHSTVKDAKALIKAFTPQPTT